MLTTITETDCIAFAIPNCGSAEAGELESIMHDSCTPVPVANGDLHQLFSLQTYVIHDIIITQAVPMRDHSNRTCKVAQSDARDERQLYFTAGAISTLTLSGYGGNFNASPESMSGASPHVILHACSHLYYLKWHRQKQLCDAFLLFFYHIDLSSVQTFGSDQHVTTTFFIVSYYSLALYITKDSSVVAHAAFGADVAAVLVAEPESIVEDVITKRCGATVRNSLSKTIRTLLGGERVDMMLRKSRTLRGVQNKSSPKKHRRYFVR